MPFYSNRGGHMPIPPMTIRVFTGEPLRKRKCISSLEPSNKTTQNVTRRLTSQSVPEAEAFVSEKADLEISVGCDAEAIASAAEVLAHRRDESHPASMQQQRQVVMRQGSRNISSTSRVLPSKRAHA